MWVLYCWLPTLTTHKNCNTCCRFTLNRNTNKCEFFCEGGCGAGVCIGPNKCSCKPGFKLIQDTCMAECPKGCKNGKCIGPNVCGCDPGWTLDKTGTICEPHCREPCLNADCTAPNTCTCKKGYTSDPSNPSGNRCVAHCPGGCENGTCSAPNFCICNPGFVKEVKGSNRCVRRLKRSPLMHFELIPQQKV
jgi:hypothetical protein